MILVASSGSILALVYPIGLMSKVFTSGSGDRGSIQSRVIPKTKKTILDAILINTEPYEVRIKGKVMQSREWSSTLRNTYM